MEDHPLVGTAMTATDKILAASVAWRQSQYELRQAWNRAKAAEKAYIEAMMPVAVPFAAVRVGDPYKAGKLDGAAEKRKVPACSLNPL